MRQAVLVTHFIQGAAVGFLLAIPVGPVALICIRQALLHGLLCGFLTGLGAAGADALFSYLAAYGVSALSETVVWHSQSIRLLGGGVLFLFGIVVFRQKTLNRRGRQPRNLVGSALATFLLTVSNPAVLLAFGAIFAASGIAHEPMDGPRVAALVLGVFSGSCTWWLSLSGLSELFRNRLTLDLLLRINRWLGLLIGGIGLAAIASAIAF